MGDSSGTGASFDEIIQEGRRKRAAEKLAQEIFGKKGRASAPPSGPRATLGGSLASRVGVTKRNSPSPRSTAPRPPRAQLHTRPAANDNYRPRLSHTQSSAADFGSHARNNGYDSDAADANGGEHGMNIKGAAAGPYIVIAQNFALGTTAADIESVMLGVGGQMSSCKLVASNPTVIAEMNFTEKVGAEKVIETFNGKKADGRPLYVYWKNGGAAGSKPNPPAPSRSRSDFGVLPSSGDVGEVTMEVDENAESREVQDRLREERRGRDDRPPQDVLPTGPRGYQSEMDRYDDRRPRRPEPGYQDGRYGFGGRGGYRDGTRGRYPRDDRRFGGGPGWRRG